MFRFVSIAALGSLLLVGCGEDDTTSSAPAGTPSTSETAPATPSAATSPPVEPGEEPGEESCPFLALDAVTAALGEEMEIAATGPATCLFDAVAQASPASATLNVTELEIDPAEYAAGTRDLCEGPVTEVEGGDQAFACVTFVGPQGHYFEGSRSVVVDVVSTDGSEASALTAAAALLTSLDLG